VNLSRPTRPPRFNFAMMRLREFWIASSLLDQPIVRDFACLIPSQVKNGTRKSIATIGMLSGADEIFQSWCQSWTLKIAQIQQTTRQPANQLASSI
jgi:hypothetical protein